MTQRDWLLCRRRQKIVTAIADDAKLLGRRIVWSYVFWRRWTSSLMIYREILLLTCWRHTCTPVMKSWWESWHRRCDVLVRFEARRRSALLLVTDCHHYWKTQRKSTTTRRRRRSNSSSSSSSWNTGSTALALYNHGWKLSVPLKHLLCHHCQLFRSSRSHWQDVLCDDLMRTPSTTATAAAAAAGVLFTGRLDMACHHAWQLMAMDIASDCSTLRRVSLHHICTRAVCCCTLVADPGANVSVDRLYRVNDSNRTTCVPNPARRFIPGANGWRKWIFLLASAC